MILRHAFSGGKRHVFLRPIKPEHFCGFPYLHYQSNRSIIVYILWKVCVSVMWGIFVGLGPVSYTHLGGKEYYALSAEKLNAE